VLWPPRGVVELTGTRGQPITVEHFPLSVELDNRDRKLAECLTGDARL
jgi:hypothetical protein